MRRFDPSIEWFCEDYTEDYKQRTIMEESAQGGEYVLWIDANSALNELQRKFDVLHRQYLDLDDENTELRRELDPESMEGWDE